MVLVAQRILILGSTGSIGTQALEVIAENPHLFEVVGIAAAGSSARQIIEQARSLGLPPSRVAVARPESAREVSETLGGTVLDGPDAARDLVQALDAARGMDVVLNALVGSMGLQATMASLHAGVRLALANKESLVAGGEVVLGSAAEGQLVPVDSEHSAMAQCLRSGTRGEVERLVLTASGGPFRGRSREQMWEVTPEQAAAHPTWSMGQMNTLNSATLVNKGLELIEAALLFGVEPSAIDVTVHPQSIVHSMVTFSDGATIAQASPPSMKLPIALALGWPDRAPGAEAALDFSQAFSWDFEPVDNAVFPAVELARAAVEQGGSHPAIYNAANEEAAASFLHGGIRFPQIVDVVERVLSQADGWAIRPTTVTEVLEVEAQARRRAQEIVATLAR
ncbi:MULTISPECIES: 1-deoxy-D-xylulose-5-phosphate reductoisomerase [unclassified Corynebacterium]|uniref:1-deoxy-D-xylulose-5-phosphate reductoisomerase n=1 Tax=unclassified Corynebacterium TaxID=2624378 RepID=UPI0029C9CB32|nr:MULTISPECIES: 1-deoxy-D-xylulose-5-phosphate reductoisomerase [unclassified Corynebacterium]WPF65319.1 1-deoxy-D-xylulose-5-phosphate reductoisomerase [Corynebacterium sp. 22KM0430]WPF67814.1 1-deoxy-D-xylulose-5-phosphate reductoisomerase [Corynebacterium sp. 21KM1197]